VRGGLFVTGTDTGVGKTIVSAALIRRYRSRIPGLRYWKPVQTGIERDDDTATVRRLSGCGAAGIVDAGVRLPRPLSPHLSARHAGVTIDVGSLARTATRELRRTSLIVEGAGGLLVPLNDTELIADLIAALKMPVLVVARSRLGTINHTLLTLAALRERRIGVAGVVMVGPVNAANRGAIEAYGRVKVLAELPRLRPLTPASLRGWALSSLDTSNHLEQWLH
jgi:dethiobiotin synthase